MNMLSENVLIDEPTGTIAYETEYDNGNADIVLKTMTEQDAYDAIVDVAVG